MIGFIKVRVPRKYNYVTTILYDDFYFLIKLFILTEFELH